MFTRRSLAALTGLAAGSLSAQAAAQPAVRPFVDGGRRFVELHGAAIAPGLDVIRTSGDLVAGVGAATFSTLVTKSPFARRFTAADGRVFEMQADSAGWSLSAFGMLPCAASDMAQAAANREAHQRAVDHAVWLSMQGLGTQRLVFTPGQYHIDGAIKVFRHNPEDGSFAYVSLEIAARPAAMSTATKP